LTRGLGPMAKETLAAARLGNFPVATSTIREA
jgi:hypothetical protein